MGITCSVIAIDKTEVHNIERSKKAQEKFFESSEGEIWNEKSWQAINFLLTGSDCGGDPPLNFLVSGGRSLSGFARRDGDVRYFSPAQVASISNALSSISPEALLARYDSRMTEEADPDEQQEINDYISDNYTMLRDYVKSMYSRGKAMIIVLG